MRKIIRTLLNPGINSAQTENCRPLINLATELESQAQSSFPSVGGATVQPYGLAREAVLFRPTTGVKFAAYYLATNWLQRMNGGLLDSFLDQVLAAKRNGVEVFVMFELLSPLSHWMRIQRVCEVPDYGGLVNPDDVKEENRRIVTPTSFHRYLTPGATQFKHSYAKATDDHFETVKSVSRFFDEARRAGIGCVVQFQYEQSNPRAYSLFEMDGGEVAPLLADGFYENERDESNYGYLTTDEFAIECARRSASDPFEPRPNAKELLHKVFDDRVLRAAHLEVNLFTDGVREDLPMWRF